MKIIITSLDKKKRVIIKYKKITINRKLYLNPMMINQTN